MSPHQPRSPLEEILSAFVLPASDAAGEKMRQVFLDVPTSVAQELVDVGVRDTAALLRSAAETIDVLAKYHEVILRLEPRDALRITGTFEIALPMLAARVHARAEHVVAVDTLSVEKMRLTLKQRRFLALMALSLEQYEQADVPITASGLNPWLVAMGAWAVASQVFDLYYFDDEQVSPPSALLLCTPACSARSSSGSCRSRCSSPPSASTSRREPPLAAPSPRHGSDG